MRSLQQTQIAAARSTLAACARLLEQALFAFRIDGGDAADVLAELARFQNADGGFGNGLEPDMHSPSSSPLQTAVAFQMLKELGVSGDIPMVQAALGYLVATYDSESGSWPVTPVDVEDFPHAPWWVQAASLPSAQNLNPSAELVGVVLEYRDHVDVAWAEAVVESMRSRLAQVERLEMHELLCVLRLAETTSIADGWRADLKTLLLAASAANVVADKEEWEGYGLRPVDVAPSPGSLLGVEYGVAASEYCDYLIETAAEDGTWAPAWSWSEQYPDGWELARRAWTGIVTSSNLRILRSYGRLPQ